MKRTLVVCNCSSIEHQMVINSFEDEPDQLYIEMHLTKHSFWKRLKYGIRYIFGYQCKYGAFEEIIIDKDRLIESLEGVRNPGVYGQGNRFIAGKEQSYFQRNLAKLKLLHGDLMERLSEVLDCKVYVWSDTGSYTINVRLENYEETETVEVYFYTLCNDIEDGHTDFKYFKETYSNV